MPEILDGLPNHNPSAIRSRRDLRRVNLAMRSRSIVARALRSSHLFQRESSKLRILEIGAGDGHLMLRVAQTLQARWRDVEMTLLDQIDLVEASTAARYAALGWHVSPVVGDVLAWAVDATKVVRDGAGDDRWDLIIANLFLHHFEGPQLAALLGAIEARAECFVACEPRRSGMARFGSHLIGALGVNAVTRADAVSSVVAGFRDSELSNVWPGTVRRWMLKEYSAGLFSHCFTAERLNQ